MVALYLFKFSKERWSKAKDEDKTFMKIFRKILWIAATGLFAKYLELVIFNFSPILDC